MSEWYEFTNTRYSVMITKFPVGSTDENNRLNLPAGFITIDAERKALRFFDGETQGGFEVLGQQAYVRPPPGPQEVVNGTNELGYYGAVSSAQFITALALRNQVFSNSQPVQWDNGWLKYSYQGKTLYIAKTPISTANSWTGLNGKGIVFGTTVVTIDGFNYKVRIMTGGNADPANTTGGEFSALIVSTIDNGWGGFNAKALNNAPTYDYRELCQESIAGDDTRCVYRWTEQRNVFATQAKGSGSSAFAWRPVLELIP